MFQQKNLHKFLLIFSMIFIGLSQPVFAQGDHDGPYPFHMKGKVYIDLTQSLPIDVEILSVKSVEKIESRTTIFEADGVVRFKVYPEMIMGEYEIEEIRYTPPLKTRGASQVNQRHYLTIIARSPKGDILVLDLYTSSSKQSWYLGRVNFIGTRNAHSAIFGRYIGKGLPVRLETIKLKNAKK